VARPELAEALVTAVLAPAARTTCLVGAGGFGKTTLALWTGNGSFPRVRTTVRSLCEAVTRPEPRPRR
jgi:predicted ATPase